MQTWKPLDDVLAYTVPDGYLGLEDQLREQFSQDDLCPLLVEEDDSELWQGGCQTEDGTRIEGTLRVFNDGRLSGDAFSVSAGNQLALYIDGTLEFSEFGDLLQFECIGFFCGIADDSCVDGPIQLDMAASIYPYSSYPQFYDYSASGSISSEPIPFEGSWSIDTMECEREAMDGLFGILRERRHDLVMDGARNCDGCADWSIQGSSVAYYCSPELEAVR
jgi:hypothetical protein